MKIIHINASDIGSTGKIIERIIIESNKKGFESAFLFPRKHKKDYVCKNVYGVSLKYEQGLYRRIYYLNGLHYGFAPLSTRKILRILDNEKPDIVHLHSINCATVNIYKLLEYLKRKNIATVVTNHAEFFYTGNCPHSLDCNRWMSGCGDCPTLFYATGALLFDRSAYAWKKMKRSFENFDALVFVSVSPWVYSRACKSPIVNTHKQVVIFNGIDESIFNDSKLYFCNKKKRTIIHVTPFFSDVEYSKKGGGYIVEIAKRLLDKNIEILVVGPYKIRTNLPNNIRFLGLVQDQNELSALYQRADLCVVTSERETFGMTIAESLCCGTPVVGFRSGGSESIALSDYSELVDYGNVGKLTEIIINKWITEKTVQNSARISNSALKVYSGKVMSMRYCNLYEDMLQNREEYHANCTVF